MEANWKRIAESGIIHLFLNSVKHPKATHFIEAIKASINRFKTLVFQVSMRSGRPRLRGARRPEVKRVWVGNYVSSVIFIDTDRRNLVRFQTFVHNAFQKPFKAMYFRQASKTGYGVLRDSAFLARERQDLRQVQRLQRGEWEEQGFI